MDREKEILSYEKYDIMCMQLSIMLINENINYIFGIQRGGLPIAVYLSHHLNATMNNDIDFYRCNYNKKHMNILVVDDIVDRGFTLNKFSNKFKNIPFKFASLFLRKNCKSYYFLFHRNTNSDKVESCKKI